MPYIKKDMRERLCPGYRSPEVANNAGELNYLFTRVLQDYVAHIGLSYQTINDIVGALEGAKLEFQRRVIAPYEDQKIKENGDVY